MQSLWLSPRFLPRRIAGPMIAGATGDALTSPSYVLPKSDYGRNIFNHRQHIIQQM
jgi:hypothetical protein